MSIEFKRLLEKGKIEKKEIDKDMINKEIEGAEYDLETSEESINNEDFKWATIQAYYSMFHSIRALIYFKGYRENSHYALLIAFKELYVHSGLIDKRFSNYFEEAMDLRESADYNLTFSENSAKEVLKRAKEMLIEIKKLIKW
ncbi:MAG: HEPN domain-containing protein [Candidatus Nanoarchaeia archaeon]|nr:HEPN domain-containing protein [Candidatus Nanoarchaeia archaeon]MDD5587578.1 HEPN domain-containing protein [Candidatus Nanoarchaeia archaeon]